MHNPLATPGSSCAKWTRAASLCVDNSARFSGISANSPGLLLDNQRVYYGSTVIRRSADNPSCGRLSQSLQYFVAYHSAILFSWMGSQLGELERLHNGWLTAGISLRFPGLWIDNVICSSTNSWTGGTHQCGCQFLICERYWLS